MLVKVKKSFMYGNCMGNVGKEITIKDSDTLTLLEKKGLVERTPEKNASGKASDSNGKQENKI